MTVRKLTLLASIIALSGCIESSDDSDGDNDGGNSSVLTGVFVDSPVSNMDYQTASQSGVTNSSGEYKYLDGETVTFSIGDLELPATPALAQVTPADMVDNVSTGEERTNQVTNILRLLQTLDTDGDPDNGIQIADAAKTAATAVEFNQTLQAFEEDQNVQGLIEQGGQTAPVSELVDTQQAIDHFKEQSVGQLPGAYFLGTDDDYNIAIFTEDGRYYVAHNKNKEPINPDAPDADLVTYAVSGEYGTYEWDPLFAELSATKLNDSDGEGGLTNEATTITAQLRVIDDELLLDKTNESDRAKRIYSASNPLVGAWLLEDSATDYNIIVFTEGGQYFVAHTINREYDSVLETTLAVSGEYGTYSVSGDTITYNKLGESDGDGGVMEEAQSQKTAKFAISDNQLTNPDDSSEPPLVRIGK